MDLTWLGHSCFRIRSDETSIITDPYPPSIGLELREPAPTLATVSHRHPNHSCREALAGDPRVLDGPGEYELSGIYVTGVMTPRAGGDPPGKRNTAYLFEIERLRVCHMGDVSAKLSPRQIQELTPLDILLIPVGGACTIDAPGAAEMVRALGPRVVVPMHYRLPGLNLDTAVAEAPTTPELPTDPAPTAAQEDLSPDATPGLEHRDAPGALQLGLLDFSSQAEASPASPGEQPSPADQEEAQRPAPSLAEPASQTLEVVSPGPAPELGPVDDFLREMGLRDVAPQPRLTISATSLPAELRIVLLEPRGLPRSS